MNCTIKDFNPAIPMVLMLTSTTKKTESQVGNFNYKQGRRVLTKLQKRPRTKYSKKANACLSKYFKPKSIIRKNCSFITYTNHHL